MTTFKSALAICGLSQAEAAAFLNVSLGSVKNWCRGKSAPSRDAWRTLAGLYAHIESVSNSTRLEMKTDLMGRRATNNIEANNGPDPLPGRGAAVAGARALLLVLHKQ